MPTDHKPDAAKPNPDASTPAAPDHPENKTVASTLVTLTIRTSKDDPTPVYANFFLAEKANGDVKFRPVTKTEKDDAGNYQDVKDDKGNLVPDHDYRISLSKTANGPTGVLNVSRLDGDKFEKGFTVSLFPSKPDAPVHSFANAQTYSQMVPAARKNDEGTYAPVTDTAAFEKFLTAMRANYEVTLANANERKAAAEPPKAAAA